MLVSTAQQSESAIHIRICIFYKYLSGIIVRKWPKHLVVVMGRHLEHHIEFWWVKNSFKAILVAVMCAACTREYILIISIHWLNKVILIDQMSIWTCSFQKQLLIISHSFPYPTLPSFCVLIRPTCIIIILNRLQFQTLKKLISLYDTLKRKYYPNKTVEKLGLFPQVPTLYGVY